MKYLFLLIVLLSFLSVSVDPVLIIHRESRVIEPCENRVCYQPLSPYDQCLEDLKRRGQFDDYHKAFCDPRFIPSDRLPTPIPESL